MEDSDETATIWFRQQTIDLPPADVTGEMLVAVFAGLEVAPRVLVEETTGRPNSEVLLTKTVAGRQYRVRESSGSKKVVNEGMEVKALAVRFASTMYCIVMVAWAILLRQGANNYLLSCLRIGDRFNSKPVKPVFWPFFGENTRNRFFEALKTG